MYITYKCQDDRSRVDFLITLIDNRGMSPFLEQTTNIENADGMKYVSDGNRVYYAGRSEIFSSHGDLAGRLGPVEVDTEYRPIVVAAGKIFNKDGKFSFSVSTFGCHIKGDNIHKAVEAVNTAAKKILGEDRVV
jgi:hypothetical protein